MIIIMNSCWVEEGEHEETRMDACVGDDACTVVEVSGVAGYEMT